MQISQNFQKEYFQLLLHYINIFFVLLIVFHWYFLNGQCIITLGTKKEHKTGFISDILDKYNINRITFDILLYIINC